MENGDKIKVHERLSTLEAQMDTVLDNIYHTYRNQ